MIDVSGLCLTAKTLRTRARRLSQLIVSYARRRNTNLIIQYQVSSGPRSPQPIFSLSYSSCRVTVSSMSEFFNSQRAVNVLENFQTILIKRYKRGLRRNTWQSLKEIVNTINRWETRFSWLFRTDLFLSWIGFDFSLRGIGVQHRLSQLTGTFDDKKEYLSTHFLRGSIFRNQN